MDDPTEDATEFYEERAAIMEHDGGIKRYNAQFYAEHLTRVYCRRKGKPLPKGPKFHAFSLGTTAWDEETGSAYYVPAPPYERQSR